MTENINFITYPEMLEQLETTNLENHLLLGNGFNLSLGIKTGYKDIFQQMKINNSDYKSVMGENFDLENFIGECKKQISSQNNPHYEFMTKFYHNKIKLDFMNAVTQIVSKEIKNIYQEKNEKIYLLLKNFNNFFTLNYDPFLYQFLMSFKKEPEKAIAFSPEFPFIKDLVQEEDKKLFDLIHEAYLSGELSVSIPNHPKKTSDLKNMKKSDFSREIQNYLKDSYPKKQIQRVVNKIWDEINKKNGKYIENLDDGFGLFGKELVYIHPETQNLFFLHGAFHIYKKGKSIYKITQQSEKSLYHRIEEIVENSEENILCIFSDTNKMQEINQEEYFLNGINRLGEIKGNIVIIGCSFSDNDNHIFNQIKNSEIETIYVAAFKTEMEKISLIKKLFSNKKIVFFDIETITYSK